MGFWLGDPPVVANLAGLLAAAATTIAVAFICSVALYEAGVSSMPKWLMYGIVGVSLSVGVTAFQYARKFASDRPRLRYELSKLVLFLVGAGVIFGLTEFYSKWNAGDELHRAMLTAQVEIDRQLPKKVDDQTTLVATRVDFNNWTYVYNVTNPNFDRQVLQTKVHRGVCTGNLKEWIAKGVSYTFEYWEATDLLTSFQVASCP